ncbi:hypothetical protein WJX77_006195 [Trebouxia sp. C0004]
MELDQENLDTDNQRFGSRQKEGEHSPRIDRERAELENRSAKRSCFNARTDDGITCRNLPEDAEGASHAKGFEDEENESRTGSSQGFHGADHRQSQASAIQYRGSGCHSQVHHREQGCQVRMHG